jgi:endonuclease YncB( thermonuclease family)
MGLTLIKGTFRLDAGDPDGDSVRFQAENNHLLARLRGREVAIKSDGTVQLRYEGIDSLEKAAIQPWAEESRRQNFALLRKYDHPSSLAPRGFILAGHSDANRRPVCFVFTGELEAEDGSTVFLDGPLVRRSVNHQLVATGFAYTLFYQTLFPQIRHELTQAFLSARAAQRGLHQQDATMKGVRLQHRQDLGTIPPIFPKLWRRLNEYLHHQSAISGFQDWLASRNGDLLSTPAAPHTWLRFHQVVAVQAESVKLLVEPFALLFHPRS